MEDKNLQLELARKFWEIVDGDPKSCMPIINPSQFSKEEELAIQVLLNKGVIQRRNGCYFICSTTMEFIKNGGKTNFEIEKEKEEYRKEESLRVAKEANRISKYSMWISVIAIIISIVSIIVSFSDK